MPGQMTPLMASIEQASHMLGLCRATIYGEIGAGRLLAKKCARRTLIPVEEIQRYLAALPDAQIKPRLRKPRRKPEAAHAHA